MTHFNFDYLQYEFQYNKRVKVWHLHQNPSASPRFVLHFTYSSPLEHGRPITQLTVLVSRTGLVRDSDPKTIAQKRKVAVMDLMWKNMLLKAGWSSRISKLYLTLYEVQSSILGEILTQNQIHDGQDASKQTCDNFLASYVKFDGKEVL